jgi:hypothetical protein
MSRRSRKRLLESFARLDVGQSRVLWVTLTYADLPAGACEFQRDIVAFRRRLMRRYPQAAVKWVKQFDSSGARVWHPHLHFCLYNVGFIAQDELAEMWGHGFVWVEALISHRQAAAYAARYCANASLDYVPYLAATGRMWGEWNRSSLPWAVPFVFEMPAGVWFHQVKRSARHVWPGVNRKRWAGFTLFRSDPDAWVNLILNYAAGC